LMQGLRQLGMAIAISVVSLGLVVGGLSLALSENVAPPPMATETFWLPTFAEFITPTETSLVIPTDTFIPTITSTMPAPTGCTPPTGWVGVVVGPSDSLQTMATRYKTTAPLLIQSNCLLSTSLVAGSVLFVPPVIASTAVPCGAPYGWVRYSVHAGDTLYRIATSYGITTSQLQQANCLGTSTMIRTGQLLWVPNLPTRTPAVTLVPTYYFPTLPLTETALPFTGTPEPPTATTQPTQTSQPATITALP
jgi:LysM repeat protein